MISGQAPYHVVW